MAETKIAYRPEVDGLRAIAVLSVFVFHLNRHWLPGGFVGVDIFFVISGYLITSILLQACEEKQFSLAKFYQRRIARLFPAFFTVALSTLAGAALIYTPQDLASAGANLVAASLSLANIKLMMQGDYFKIVPDAQPFLHYWSLSVEEQFYLLYPTTLYFIFSYARRKLSLILTTVTIISYFASILVTHFNPAWAFYLLPTRAWELCVGALVAHETRKGWAPAVSWLSFVGVSLITASFLLIHEGLSFPGWVAAMPVAGAAAILIPGVKTKDSIKSLLSSGAMVRIGKMSYSLYLWHWPAFCLIDYEFYKIPELPRVGLKIITPIVLTIITYNFIENPARIFLNRRNNRAIAYAFFVTMLVICVPVGISIRNDNYVNAELSDVSKGGLVFAGRPGEPSIVLMGDSKGSMYGKTIKAICSQLGYNLTVISVAAGDPLPSRSHMSSALWVDSLAVVRAVKPDYLVFGAAWASKLEGDPERLAVALEALKPYAKHIILLNEPPVLPKEANRASIRNGGQGPFWEPPNERSERRKISKYLLRFVSPNVSVIDIARHFERGNGSVMFVDGHGRELYHDSNHLSGYGADRIRDVLHQALTGRAQ